MGKKGKGGKSNKTPKLSSGNRRGARLRKALRRLNMKIARWNRYQTDPAKNMPLPKGHKCSRVCRSRHNKWDTTGLCEHAQLLERAIKEGKSKRFAKQGEA